MEEQLLVSPKGAIQLFLSPHAAPMLYEETIFGVSQGGHSGIFITSIKYTLYEETTFGVSQSGLLIQVWI